MSEVEGFESEAANVDLSKLSELCNRLVDADKEISELEARIKKIKDSVAEDNEKLLTYMTESGLERLDGKHGHVEVDELISVRQPATHEEKIQFFKYLEDQGLFYNMVSVNSRTLSSWAKKEIKAMEDKTGQQGWTPPGLQAPYREFKLKVKPRKS